MKWTEQEILEAVERFRQMALQAIDERDRAMDQDHKLRAALVDAKVQADEEKAILRAAYKAAERQRDEAQDDLAQAEASRDQYRAMGEQAVKDRDEAQAALLSFEADLRKAIEKAKVNGQVNKDRIAEIKSLTEENGKLRADIATARREAAEHKAHVETLKGTLEDITLLKAGEKDAKIAALELELQRLEEDLTEAKNDKERAESDANTAEKKQAEAEKKVETLNEKIEDLEGTIEEMRTEKSRFALAGLVRVEGYPAARPWDVDAEDALKMAKEAVENGYRPILRWTH